MDFMNATRQKTTNESVFPQPEILEKEKQQELNPYAQQFAEQREELKKHPEQQTLDRQRELERVKNIREMLSQAFAMREDNQMAVPVQSMLTGNFKEALHDKAFFTKTREQKIENARSRMDQKAANAALLDSEEERLRKEREELLRLLNSISEAEMKALGLTDQQIRDLAALALMLKQDNEAPDDRFTDLTNNYAEPAVDNGGDINE